MGFFQDGGVFEGGTWATPKPYVPRTMCSFQLQVPEGVPLTPIAPTGKCYLLSWDRGSKTRMGFTLECMDRDVSN